MNRRGPYTIILYDYLLKETIRYSQPFMSQKAAALRFAKGCLRGQYMDAVIVDRFEQAETIVKSGRTISFIPAWYEKYVEYLEIIHKVADRDAERERKTCPCAIQTKLLGRIGEKNQHSCFQCRLEGTHSASCAKCKGE